MPAKEHLPRRPAVDEDDRAFFRGPVLDVALEQLSVHGKSIGCLKDNLLRNHQLCAWKIRGNSIRPDPCYRSTGDGHHTRHWWPLRSGADKCDVFAVPGDFRRPSEIFSGRENVDTR